MIHLEIQNQKEVNFENRIYVYNYCLRARYEENVFSLVVHGDSDPDCLAAEQTLSCFLPAIIAPKPLRNLGLNAYDALQRTFGIDATDITEVMRPNGKGDLSKLDSLTQTFWEV